MILFVFTFVFLLHQVIKHEIYFFFGESSLAHIIVYFFSKTTKSQYIFRNTRNFGMYLLQAK